MKKYPKDKLATRILLVWILLLAILFSILSIVRHNRFESGGFDLGLYDQTVWQYAQFLRPYNTIKDRFILGDHLTLTLPLLAPLYWLWDNVRMLLIFQAAWITSSAIAIYMLARFRNIGSFASVVVALLYSLFYGVQYAVFFDFHPVVIGVGLAAWFVYFFETEKTKLAWITLGLLLLTQENMGLLASSLGLIYIWKKQFRTPGLFLVIGGIAASLAASKIIAAFSPVGFQYWPQIPTQPLEVIRQFTDQLEKRQVLWYSFSWFLFLPILSPGALLATFFDLAQYFVTGPEFSRMWSPYMHHRITLAPILTLGTLDALEMFKKNRNIISTLSFLLLIGILLNQYFLHLPLNKLAKTEFWKKEEWMADNRSLISRLDPALKLATQQNLAPHVSHRTHVYLIWPRPHDFDDNRCARRSCWWLDFDSSSEYLLIDTRPHQWLTQILETNENFQEAIKNMESYGALKLVQSTGFARLYKVVR